MLADSRKAGASLFVGAFNNIALKPARHFDVQQAKPGGTPCFSIKL
jgi:hypothetical protein